MATNTVCFTTSERVIPFTSEFSICLRNWGIFKPSILWLLYGSTMVNFDNQFYHFICPLEFILSCFLSIPRLGLRWSTPLHPKWRLIICHVWASLFIIKMLCQHNVYGWVGFDLFFKNSHPKRINVILFYICFRWMIPSPQLGGFLCLRQQKEKRCLRLADFAVPQGLWKTKLGDIWFLPFLFGRVLVSLRWCISPDMLSILGTPENVVLQLGLAQCNLSPNYCLRIEAAACTLFWRQLTILKKSVLRLL